MEAGNRWRVFIAIACVLALCMIGRVQAAVHVEMVTVGHPGNPADGEVMNDGTKGYGTVGHVYRIGKFEVTAGQYVVFLNAVAKSDPYRLYNSKMWTHPWGCKIQRQGTPGDYSYRLALEMSRRPANCISFWDACRFANWLHNGQPVGGPGVSTTEDGAYALNGYNGADGRPITRNPGARWAIPSENEWYKSAFSKRVSSGYWDYATQNDAVPAGQAPPGAKNSANYNDVVRRPTDVGAYPLASSAWGTFDQNGNVWEWNEAVTRGSYRGCRGGSFYLGSAFLPSRLRSGHSPEDDYITMGFRVVEMVPGQDAKSPAH